VNFYLYPTNLGLSRGLVPVRPSGCISLWVARPWLLILIFLLILIWWIRSLTTQSWRFIGNPWHSSPACTKEI